MCVYAWYDLRPMVLWLRPLRQPKNSAPRSSVVADIGLLTCCRCTASRVACSYPHVPGRGEIPTSISRVDHATGLDQHHRSEEHTSELQSRGHLVCRLLLEK